jgi:hypothetical protein
MDTSLVSRKAEPKDIFLHVFSMIALYASAGSVIGILFSVIDRWLPDALSYGGGSVAGLRFALATALVAFPAYLVSMRAIEHSYKADSGLIGLRIRKALVYLTLFVACVILAGDLISVLYAFLNGEITPRFIAKAGSVFLIAGLIAKYYLEDARRAEGITQPKMQGIVKIASIALVVLAWGAGMVVAGTPAATRTEGLDQRRTEDLQGITWKVDEFYRMHETLPTSFAEMYGENVPEEALPHDPRTGSLYEYTVKATSTYELCATFETAWPTGADTTPYMDYSWAHKEGRTCFSRVVGSVK